MMALTVDNLVNDERFTGDSVLLFLLYLPFGLLLVCVRILLGLVLWIASIILPNKSSVRQILSFLACLTFGVYVKLQGSRDRRSSLLVANYVSALDSLAASHTLGSISLRKWKLPPFFASALGIRNTAQFVRKQHFSDSPNKPVLLQPEGGPTNGTGLLLFQDWPFPIGNRVQPVTISVERAFTCVSTPHAAERVPWADVLWFLWTPVTHYTLRLLPALQREEESEGQFAERVRRAIASALQVEVTDYRWEQLSRRRGVAGGSSAGSPGAGAGGARELQLARRVKEVLPRVPMRDILTDLARTRSVDVTITNFLEEITPYTPEPVAEAVPGPSQPAPKYVTPAPTGVFPASARERQLSFQERKQQMIAVARERYIEKHGLQVADNC